MGIAALSMKEFAERHLLVGNKPYATAEQIEALKERLRSYVQQGLVRIQLEQGNISLRLQGWLDSGFYNKASRAIKELLKNTPSTVTLHVEHFPVEQRRHWQRLLHRLRRNGDRIYVSASETLKDILEGAVPVTFQDLVVTFCTVTSRNWALRAAGSTTMAAFGSA